MTNRKLDIVQRLLAMIPEDQRDSEDQAMISWWANIRETGGLRLTKRGYHVMNDVLHLESWRLDLDETQTLRTKITKKTMLDLDRKLRWPYYLDIDSRKKTRHIVFFNSQEAMMATLYGDVTAWLKNL